VTEEISGFLFFALLFLKSLQLSVEAGFIF